MLKNKVALVTGASRGIGRAVALLFAQEGASVIVNYRENEKHALDLVTLIKQKGGKATLIQGDVGVEKDVDKIFAHIKQEYDRLDILVNNAGILKNNLLNMVSVREFDSIMATNCRGTFLCTRAALKGMISRQSGKIINISSVAGVYGNRGQGVYAMSKSAVIGFTKSIAKEVGSFGVTVNAIAPGFIDTDMVKVIPKKVHTDILSTIALGRVGTPEDVAKVALFLASPLADYVSGQVLGVDGGQIL